MKTLSTLTLLVGVFAFLSSNSAQAHGKYCAVLYEDINFGGSNHIVWGTQGSSSFVGNTLNDSFSSAIVGEGCTLTVYQHELFEGPSSTLQHSTRYVGDNFNDAISSYKCSCKN